MTLKLGKSSEGFIFLFQMKCCLRKILKIIYFKSARKNTNETKIRSRFKVLLQFSNTCRGTTIVKTGKTYWVAMEVKPWNFKIEIKNYLSPEDVSGSNHIYLILSRET